MENWVPVLVVIWVLSRKIWEAQQKKRARSVRPSQTVLPGARGGDRPLLRVRPIPERSPDLPEANAVNDVVQEKIASERDVVPAGKSNDMRRWVLQGVIMSEVLGPPRGRRPWRSKV